MKKLLSILLSGFMSLGAMAGTGQTTFQYWEGPLGMSGWNQDGARETLDIAICLNDPSLAGMKITSIKAYIAPATPTAVNKTSLWLSKELKLVSRVNQPDIASYDVTVERVQMDEDQYYGQLYVELDEPYVLGADPIYVGYSMTIPALNTQAQKQPILLGRPANKNGLFVHATKNVLQWTDMGLNAPGSAAIVVGLEGEFEDYCLDVKPVTSSVYIGENEPFTVPVPVVNVGSEPISTLSYTYQIDGGEIQTGLSTVDTPLTTSLGASVDVPFSFISIPNEGSHEVSLTVNEINGHPNTSQASSGSFTVHVLGFVPKHLSLVEEFTGLSCTYCARGWLLMERLNKNYYNNQVSLIWHKYGNTTSDPMITSYELPVYVSGYPKATINRNGTTDPYFGNGGNGLSQTVLSENNSLALMAIDVTAERQGSIITATADVEFIQDLLNNGYKVGFVLAGNNLYSPDFKQSNVYSGSDYSNVLLPGLEELAALPNPITGIYYNFVVLDASSSMGIANSLPSYIRMREHYKVEKSFNISNISQTKYMVDPDDFMVAAFVLNPDGTVANAAKFSFVEWPYTEPGDDDPSGVDEIAAAPGQVDNVYYNLQGIRVSNPVPGQIYIVNGKKVIL